MAFAERPFRLQQFRIDQSLDDDLGIGRHVEIDGDAFHRADRLAGERARHAHLVHVDGSFCGPVNTTTGAQPITMAHGIGVLSLRCLSQCW